MISVSRHVYFIWCSQNIKLPKNERHELKEEFTKKTRLGFLIGWFHVHVVDEIYLGFQATAEEWF